MTAKELIKQLKKLDSNANVFWYEGKLKFRSINTIDQQNLGHENIVLLSEKDKKEVYND